MPQSYQEHNGDNSTHTYTIAFGSGTTKYLKREHIKLYYGRDRVAGTQTNTLTLDTDYVYISEFVIKLIGSTLNTGVTVGDPYPLASGRKLTIERDTPQDSLLVPWADGSQLTKEALETSNLQVLFGQQEEADTGLLNSTEARAATTASDTATANVTALTASKVSKDGSVAMTGNLQLGTNRITGVGDPTGAQDAVTKAFLERTGSVSSGMIANDSIVDADINSSAAISQSKIATGTLPSGIQVNSANIVNSSIVDEDIATGTLDNRYYTETELNAGQLDNRYYTETEADARFYNLASAEEIQSGESWVAADNKVATTAAIDARIVDLVDDVGGFVPIANETSFPNANPDVNNGAGTLVSVPLANSLTSNAGGYISISNGTVGNSTVTIVGAGTNKTYASGFGIIVETTTTLNQYVFHRYVPKATEVTTVAGNIANVNTVAGISSNVTAVSGISSNVTTLAGNTTNINTCATNISAITGASTQATNAASSATAAASSATAAASSSTTASTQASNSASSASASSASASTASTQATNSATSATASAASEANALAYRNTAETYKIAAQGFRDATSGIYTQAESGPYNLADNVSSHTAWGDITDTGANAVFENETSNILLTMSEGSSSYDYGAVA